MASATILHADLDAFYASVEQLLDPSLRGRPIAVGGGVVLAASYEARRFGVRGGMSGVEAKRLCPGLRFVDGHFREYQRLSDQVMAVFDDITPSVQKVSIDEAFLDVSGARRLLGSPITIAESIRRRVRTEIGLPISIGVARTKHLAKVASQVAKPDGLVVVEPDEERTFLDPLSVGLIWGIGPVARQRLADRGIHTIGELARSNPGALEAVLGRALGAKAGALAMNDDHRKVLPTGRAGSVGAQSAFGRRVATDELRCEVLGHLADRVAARLRKGDRGGRTVTVRVRFGAMRAVTRSATFSDPVSSTRTIAEVANRLVGSALEDHPNEREVSLFAISVSNLVGTASVQLELPFLADDALRAGSAMAGERVAVDASLDAIRARFGNAAAGYGGVVFGRHRGVDDDFRELAERSA